MAKEPTKIKKSIYFFKDKDGSFKPIWSHTYMKDFGSTGRKSYNIYRKTNNYKRKPFYGRFYRASEIKKNKKQYSRKKIKRRSVRRSPRRSVLRQKTRRRKTRKISRRKTRDRQLKGGSRTRCCIRATTMENYKQIIQEKIDDFLADTPIGKPGPEGSTSERSFDDGKVLLDFAMKNMKGGPKRAAEEDVEVIFSEYVNWKQKMADIESQ